MRIKEVSLLGYKSFATRTRLVFPEGLTAIVGPNGSGKSNVSDAVRWVLGEGRSTALRARTANEMIFAGSEKRARGGLAEVSLTIDNADGWLDVDYPEVVITRRAERDGQGSYQINGARVRLRDVLDLLGGRLGQSSYTVIGQGLVDQFLSMRPDQRRTLIDDAAGIAPIQRRRDRAMRRLARTLDNMTRAQDILDEIGPRLRRMERLSKRAARHREVEVGLREGLATWYGFQVHRARSALRDARGYAETLLGERVAGATAVTAAETALREGEAEATAADQAAEERRSERDARAGALAAEREAAAVARTRLEALVRRRDELASEIEEAGALRVILVEQHATLEEEVAALAAEHDRRQATLDEARSALATLVEQEEARAAALAKAQEDVLALRMRQAAREARLTALDADLAQRDTQRESAQERLEALRATVTERTAEAEAAEGAWREAAEALRQIAAAAAAADRALRDNATATATALQQAARAEARLETLHTRAAALEALVAEIGTDETVLSRLTEEGVQVVGSVAELLEIPTGWDAAIAAALQDRARGVVVRDEKTVDAALLLLADASSPSLSIVPLGEEPAMVWRPASGETAAHVQIKDPRAPGLGRLLLGDLALVEDLATARAAVRREGGPRRAATRDGRLVEPGGVLTLAGEARSLLSIAREQRGLPQEIAAAEERLEAARVEAEALAEQRRTEENRAGDLADERVALEQAHDRATGARDTARAAVAQARREVQWAEESIERLSAERERLEQERGTLQAESEQDELRSAAVARALAEAQQAVDPEGLASAREFGTARAADVAEAAERLAASRARLAAARRELDGATARLDASTERREATASEIARMEAEAQKTTVGDETEAEPLAAEVAAVAAAEQEAVAAREDVRTRSAALEDARRGVARLDERLSEARLGVARAEDRLERLAEQLRSDADILPLAEQAAADLESADLAAASLPVIEELPPELERRIARQRADLRAIGAIDQEALAAFEETAERHGFLTEQLADLRAADRDLRSLIDTLEQEMAERFEETFARVAVAFERYFPQLFGGGEAELTFAKAEDDEETAEADTTGARAVSDPGIEIIARPPGKRRQPLSLLSGGERAITAVALLFALLEVSGTPFVVLDEVDAALDEANVDRFRSCLESLVASVQVVIITHNRGTVQSADTVYGVTMGEDGASRTVSLRVEEAA